MPEFQTADTSDQAVITGGSRRDIHFRPGAPGPISARSVPDRPPAHSESGLLGKLLFRKPGSATPVASSTTKLGQKLMALDYTVTAADLAAAGDWICEVINQTENDVSFKTDITYPSNIQLITHTATIDIPFLNILLSNAARAAQLRLHLQSSPSSPGSVESLASWSPDIPAKLNGSSEFRFHVDDPQKDGLTFRIVNLNSKTASLAFKPGTLTLELFLDFDVTNGKMIGLNVAPDIDLEFFAITIQLDFSGTITPICDTKAILRFNSWDISGDVKSQVESDISSRIAEAKFTPQAVAAQMIKYFSLLLRLKPEDHITGFTSEGNNLVISYTSPASAIHVGGGHQVGNAGSIAAGNA
jgi:hypothetical protein